MNQKVTSKQETNVKKIYTDPDMYKNVMDLQHWIELPV